MTTFAVTEILTYKRCKLLHNLVYRQRLTPRMEANYFYTGRLVHQTIAEWMVNPERNTESIFMEVLEGEMEALKQRYLENVGARMSDAEMDDRIETTKLPMEMVVNYQEFWKQPLPDNYRLVSPEQACLVEIPNTEHYECTSCHEVYPVSLVKGDFQIPCACGGQVTWQNCWLEGTLDGFVVDVNTGKYYVLERKTYESRPVLNTLENSEQFVAYCWILKQLFPDADLGGVLYDGLWKRPKPPRGRIDADLFFRDLLLKGSEELESYERNLIAVAKEIISNPIIYPTRIWQGCYDDKDFDRLCSAITKGDDVEYIKSEYYIERPPRWFEAKDAEEA